MAAHRTRFETIDCDCSNRRPHGTVHNYMIHRCGCDPCRKAEKRRHIDVWKRALIPSDHVRERIVLLRERGVSTKRLAATIGVHYNTLLGIARGTGEKCRSDIARSVMSYPIPDRRNPS